MFYPPTTGTGSYGGSSHRAQHINTSSECPSRRSVAHGTVGHEAIDKTFGGAGGGLVSNSGCARRTGRGISFSGDAALEVQGGGQRDRKEVLLALRRLEEHSRVS